MTNAIIDEVGELISTLLATPAHRATACRGWTAHELVAHLAAGAAEEADLIEAHLAGTAARATRPFEERELPYRALPDSELRDQLLEQATRLAVRLQRLAEHTDDGVEFTGRVMTAADFAMHSRSECALHRWDLVGRDDIGWSMLSQPELTTHAIGVLNAMSSLTESPLNRCARERRPDAKRVVLRSAPFDDVVVSLGSETITLELHPLDESQSHVELDSAARLLLLWGRREPSAAIDVTASGASLAVVGSLLGW